MVCPYDVCSGNPHVTDVYYQYVLAFARHTQAAINYPKSDDTSCADALLILEQIQCAFYAGVLLLSFFYMKYYNRLVLAVFLAVVLWRVLSLTSHHNECELDPEPRKLWMTYFDRLIVEPLARAAPPSHCVSAAPTARCITYWDCREAYRMLAQLMSFIRLVIFSLLFYYL